jgi:hypothetical protein
MQEARGKKQDNRNQRLDALCFRIMKEARSKITGSAACAV